MRTFTNFSYYEDDMNRNGKTYKLRHKYSLSQFVKSIDFLNNDKE